ncbi:Uu.00g124530.m01.CDS01 [Anthostomella pinea]|uniref:Uu.00g124530.m01.CDS01 n=1 Tax=Anthostomella pinea TaxID=933095 RepID=A0AAI8VHI1_9PEZI|nr:Uu.00g124530.m01.CDS01 [Anthostomella pinea]
MADSKATMSASTGAIPTKKSLWWTPEDPMDEFDQPETQKQPSAARIANLSKRPDLVAMGVINPATARDIHGKWRARYDAPPWLTFDDSIINTDVNGFVLNEREMAICGLGHCQFTYHCDKPIRDTNPAPTYRCQWEPRASPYKTVDLVAAKLIDPNTSLDNLGRLRIKAPAADPRLIDTDINGYYFTFDEKTTLNISVSQDVTKFSYDVCAL